ncbi:MAG: SCP2 sterol-binding domain-containing protein [Gammaproteobacteria bacterium]
MLRLALEKTLNLLIANGVVKLGKLEGHNIALHIPELGLNLCFVCINSRIYVLEAQQQSPDVDITLNRLAFLSLFKGKELKDLLANDEVVINGNVKVAQTLSDLFAETSIDVEELISQYTGDIVAHQLGKVIRFAKKRPDDNLNDIVETLKDDLSTLLVAPSRSRFFNGGAK